ncbi:MAG: hypothetical protein MR601_04610 [Erysipelotrichaceae bacterium]|nr:hypothetical protein [Erysipelotrichaceae bacterium]
MAKSILSIRVSSQTENQLFELENLEIENSSKYNVVARTKAEIIEEAIEFYYLQQMDSKKGHPYYNFFASQTKDLFENYLVKIQDAWKDISLQNLKNTELLLMFFKLLDLNTSNEMIDAVIDKDTYIEETVDEKIQKMIRRRGE